MSWRTILLLKTAVLTAAALTCAANPAAAAPPGGGGNRGGGGGPVGVSMSRPAGVAIGTLRTAGVAPSNVGRPAGVVGRPVGVSVGVGVGRPGGVSVGVGVGRPGGLSIGVGVGRPGGLSIGYYNGLYNYGYGYYPGVTSFGLSLGYAPAYVGGYYPPSFYDVGPTIYPPLETPVPNSRSFSPSLPLEVTPPAPRPVAPTDTKAYVQVVVPANATIWFDGEKTSQTGSLREFVSPPLAQGTDYLYEIRARWLENGKPVEETRTITVRGGSVTIVNFTRPAS